MQIPFYIKESHDDLEKVLKNKIKQLKKANKMYEEEKKNSLHLNKQLLDSLAKLTQKEKEIEQQKMLLEWEVKQQTKKLINKEKFSVLGQLAAGVAHDLRNPLGVIRNNTIILKKKYLKDAKYNNSNIFDRMDRAILRMSHQVEDVMDLVKKSDLKIDKCSLLEIIKNASKAVPDYENVQLKFPKGDKIIYCDGSKLERVFVNLFLNAIDAIAGKKGTIEVQFSGVKNVVVEIIDSGPPLTKEEISRFFEAFYTTKEKGTGLGLLTCKNIVEQHRGVITAYSNPTTFKIVLPKKGTKL